MASESALFEIIVGTYEKFILGYNLEVQCEAFILKASFSTEAHLQSIKCVIASEKFLASGSTDEAIQLFNMKTRQELGALLHHNGTVTGLEFFDSYLISCSEDRTICVWSTSNWQCLKTLSGHKGSVNSISIHPSGKMALSVSKDKTLRTWNLIKGRSAYVTNIKKEADLVLWSPSGSHFVVAYHKFVDVYSVKKASVLHVINFEHKICDLTFLQDNICAVVGENENVVFYDINSGNTCHNFKAHSGRIKAVKFVSINEEKFLITASSDGCIKVWHIVTHEGGFKTRKVAKVNTGARPTCMTIHLKQ